MDLDARSIRVQLLIRLAVFRPFHRSPPSMRLCLLGVVPAAAAALTPRPSSNVFKFNLGWVELEIVPRVLKSSNKESLPIPWKRFFDETFL